MPQRTNDFQQLIAQIIELLEDPEVIEESKEFPDPDTGQPREVDVYALVRGKIDGRQITIAVECVDRSRKMDVTWVEGMYGKHSRLGIADVVLLVSKKGFYHTAEVKAKRFGYKTITPKISPLKLKRTIGLGNDYQVGVQAATLNRSKVTVNTGVPGAYVDDGWFYRADHSQLVRTDEFYMHAALEPKGGPAAFANRENVSESWEIDLADPAYNGELLHIRLGTSEGGEILAPILRLRFSAKYSSTDIGHLTQTHQGEFDGFKIGTGVSTVGGESARLVVAEDTDGKFKALTKFNYEVKTHTWDDQQL